MLAYCANFSTEYRVDCTKKIGKPQSKSVMLYGRNTIKKLEHEMNYLLDLKVVPLEPRFQFPAFI